MKIVKNVALWAGVIVTLAAMALILAWPVKAQASTGTQSHPAQQTWQQAKHNVGGFACVTAKAVGAKHVNWKSGNGDMTFVDFGYAWPSKAGLTVVVWNLNAERLKGHVVTACGEISRYQGAVELQTSRMPERRN